MKMLRYYLFAVIVSYNPLSSAIAADVSQCGERYTIEIKNMGTFDEKTLNERIEEVRDELSRVPRHGNGSYVSRKQRVKNKLNKLLAARQELYDKMYIAGCEEFFDRASTEARIIVIERYMNETKKK